MAFKTNVGLSDSLAAHAHPMSVREALPVVPHPPAPKADRFKERLESPAAIGQRSDLQRVVEPNSDPTAQKPRVPRLQKLSSNSEPPFQQCAIIDRTGGAQHVAAELVFAPMATEPDVD